MALDNGTLNQLNIGGSLGIAGLVTAQNGLTVSSGATSVAALTASGLVTAQNGLTVSSGATSVAALTASGLVTVGTKGTPYKSIVSIIQTIGASASNNQSNTTNLTPYSYTDASKLIVNITMGNCGTGDVFISCLTSISTTLLTFRVFRVDTNAGWGSAVIQANITIYELA